MVIVTWTTVTDITVNVHSPSVQSGTLQSRVWMVHVVAVLHRASGDDWGSR